MLYFAGIIITVFLAIILLSKKGKTIADKVLASWLCVIGFHLFLFYWQISGEIYNHTYLLGIQVPLPLLQGPFLYIYTLTATRYTGFSGKYLLHFILPAIAYAALSKFYLLSGDEKIAVYKNKGAGFETYTAIILIAICVSGFLYVFLSFFELRKYKKRIASEFSNIEKINLNWLRYLIYGILAVWIVVIMNGDDPLIYGTVVLFVLLLGYFGIKHTGIFTYRQALIKEIKNDTKQGTAPSFVKEEIINPISEHVPVVKDVPVPVIEPTAVIAPEEIIIENEDPAIDEPDPRSKYEKSGLQKEAVDKIHRDLILLMQTEKVFKDPELSLMGLAQQLQVHPNNLSQVINTCESKNFYDYINILRIEEFKALVVMPGNERYTLLSLAFECGFNSKTSFNRNFKKITGQSPSAWVKQADVHLVNE